MNIGHIDIISLMDDAESIFREKIKNSLRVVVSFHKKKYKAPKVNT